MIHRARNSLLSLHQRLQARRRRSLIAVVVVVVVVVVAVVVVRKAVIQMKMKKARPKPERIQFWRA